MLSFDNYKNLMSEHKYYNFRARKFFDKVKPNEHQEGQTHRHYLI